MKISKNKSYLIAEIGVNHNGSLNRAKKLIDIAKSAGFDAVKFQTFNAKDLCIPYTPLVKYQKRSKFKNQFQMLKKLTFKKNSLIKVFKYCKKKKIEFISTPFDVESAIFLNNLGVNVFKISSSDLDNFYLLDKIKNFRKKIIISTGMSTNNEIKKTIDFLNLKKNVLYILHCVSDYPTKLIDTNFGYLKRIKKFGYNFGFSDHTIGKSASLAAVCLGSKIIEKHITLNKYDKGPDHLSSLESRDCLNFVKTIRDLEKSLNTNLKKMTNSEKQTKKLARKSIYSKKIIEKNEKFTEENIAILRPKMNGISPTKFFDILKIKSKRKINIFNIIKKTDY